MYVTLDILRQGKACHEGYERVLKYFTAILKNKDQHIPIWALLLSGGYSDMKWALDSCVVIDDKEFAELYKKSFPWVLEYTLDSVETEQLKKSIPKTVNGRSFVQDLIDRVDILKKSTVGEIKIEDTLSLHEEVSRLRHYYYYSNTYYNELLDNLQVLSPRTASEKVDYITRLWQVCANKPRHGGITRSNRLTRLRNELEDLEDGTSESDDEDRETLRRDIAELEEQTNPKITKVKIKDGRHPIDWSIGKEDRFVSFFDDVAFFKSLPTKHGTEIFLEKDDLNVDFEKSTLLVSKDRNGKLVKGIFVTKDPRMIHRVDRMLSRFNNTIVDDKC